MLAPDLAAFEGALRQDGHGFARLADQQAPLRLEGEEDPFGGRVSLQPALEAPEEGARLARRHPGPEGPVALEASRSLGIAGLKRRVGGAVEQGDELVVA